jgi:glycosyltransferase involved in cell wall biosynthesis
MTGGVKMKDLVSVFLPTFSRFYDGHLERTIQSVLNQTYQHFELLIVDDASVDGSKQLIEKYVKQDARIKHIRMEKNIGLPAYTTGRAYLQSKGDYLAFAYDDCILAPDHLAVLMNKLHTEPELGMSYGQAHIYWADGCKQTLGSPFDAVNMAAMNNHIPNVSVMVKRHVIESVGWYDPHFLLSRFYDWDLWVRISKHFPLGFVEKVLAEEHGTRLGDSIGNNLTLFPELIAKYTRINRDHLLLPAKLKRYNPYHLEFEKSFNSDERGKVGFLLLEYFIKTLNIDGILTQVSKMDNTANSNAALRWMKIANKNQKEDTTLLLLMQGMLEYMEIKESF